MITKLRDVWKCVVDPISMSVAALLARALGGATEEVGRGAADALGRFVVAVRARLGGNSSAEQALVAVEQKPADEERIRALADAINELLAVDETLSGNLEGIIAEAERDPQASRFISQVRDNAQVGKIVNIGQARDVSF